MTMLSIHPDFAVVTPGDLVTHNRMYTYLLGAAAIAAVLTIAKVPLAGILPFAVFLVCPLMMFFMMKGMGGMGGKEDHTGHGCEHDSTSKTHATASDHRVS